jgi:cell division protein FtsI (penicillin-binding protein 3)
VIRLSRFGIVHGALVVFAAALVARAGYVQLWQGARWEARAEVQHFQVAAVPAPRGDILDALGVPLAESHPRLTLQVAPAQVRPTDRAALLRALTRLGVSPAHRRRALDSRNQWVELPGRYLAVDLADVVRLPGVHTAPVMERVSLGTPGTSSLIGRLDTEGAAASGIERALDDVLRGDEGAVLLARDRMGKTFAAPSATREEPRPGNTVVLTIDRRLQDIAERALSNAVENLAAGGGDIVVLDPSTGEIRAMASYRNGGRFTASAPLTDPFEPGSTLKPLLIAHLLEQELVAPNEVIDTYNGRYMVGSRPIEDDHPARQLPLSDVLRLSSNIGMVRLAERLTPAQHFQALRDFGFGMPTGLPYPSESPGTLYHPRSWSKLSAASLAMGYELSVTSVQLAVAYAAIANGGTLLEPALVKEIRSPDGESVYRHSPRVVRRLMGPEVAQRVREMLIGVVDSGTAREAAMEAGPLAGKTGTARLALAGRGYSTRAHLASFIGMFPADRPKLVVLVKLVNPRGSYGGRTAAPVSKQVIEAALAARSIALDRMVPARAPAFARRGADAHVVSPVSDARGVSSARRAEVAPAVNGDAAGEPANGEPETRLVADRSGDAMPVTVANEAGELEPAAHVILLDAPPPEAPGRGAPRAIPDVRGLPLRAAVFELHRAGFRVRLAGPGRGTFPAAGVVLRGGSLVHLYDSP